jgi:hypothetical protein
MTDAPETIWRWAVQNCGGFIEYSDLPVISEHSTEYTRGDVAQAKIAELENALAAASGTIAEMRADRLAGQVLIAELADALQSILRVPNSEAAQGIMKVFALDALKPNP